ncbi:Fic family protein [Mucilaginibacter sp. OAE612]|uniref:Fic family protein n=1 Tax=Mucilaginibacter sp. OAE612 TaxID=3156444 RepID=UPI00359E2615
MNLKLEIEFSKASVLQEIDSLKKQIDEMRPLPPDVEGRVMQKLRLDWNYNSNAIEGNKLSYGETVAFLMEGITAKGKPLKDHLDIRGHNEAINFLLDMVKDDRPLSEADIRGLHEMILVEPYDVKAQTAEGMPTTKRIVPGVYKTTANHVQTATGETHYYATPEETPAKMRELMEWYYEADSNAEIHPVVVAALFHHKFVAIHPFDDGNGRLSRILMNLVLLKKGYPPVVVKMDDRRNYYSLLSRADVGENWPFIEYIIERLLWSLSLYLKGAKGEDIDEDEDVLKEIALFKIELDEVTKINEKRNSHRVKQIIISSIIPLFKKILIIIDEFVPYFTKTEKVLDMYFVDTDNIVLIRDHKKRVMSLKTWENLPDRKEGYKVDKSFSNLQTMSIAQEFLEDIIIGINNSTEDYTQLILHLNFYKLKKEDATFDISFDTTVVFDDNGYTVSDLTETLVSKKYNQKLTAADYNHITRNIFYLIKSLIELNLDI